MYAILRTKKLKNRSHITQASEHNLRLRNQSNIDSGRSHLNKILFNPLGIDQNDASSFQKKLTEHYLSLGVKEKQNNSLAFESVATASPEFFKNKSELEINNWASDQIKFMKNEFGDQLKLAVLHLDEKTPHLHFFVSTEVESVKKYKNRYGICEKKTWSLNSEKINPEYLVELQTKFAQHNKKWGLIRGVKGSRLKHVPLKVFYKMVDRIMTASYKKKINEMIDRIEISVGERLSIDSIRDKIREQLTPYINSTTREKKFYREFTKIDFHKMQEELIADQKKLKLERENIIARKKIYAEAINKDVEQSKEINNLMSENEKLRLQLLAIQKKFGVDPEINLYQNVSNAKNNQIAKLKK